MKKICVVLPTYNERSTLPLVIEKIFALRIPNLSLFVVDDNSPDGTGETAEQLRARYPIRIMHRAKKEGLGKAYTAAFLKVLAEGECDFIIQMDADLSHDPNTIPLMLKEIHIYDVVVGSRYVPGGEIKKWNFLRRCLSRFGNRYARTILQMPYRDVTSGFKCYRYEVLQELMRDSFSSVSYNFQIEILYRAHLLGYSILEIPIVFTERAAGSSKMNLFVIVESFYKILLLRAQSIFRQL